MQRVLADNLWDTVRDLSAARSSRIQAAIAFITTDHLNLRRGDLLVCDATHEAILYGKTSANVLRGAFERGVKLYSLAGLHAKMIVIDRAVIVGSANMSNNSLSLYEASVVTDNAETRSQVTTLMKSYRARAVPIDEDYLSAIEAIVPYPTKQVTQKPSRPIVVNDPRIWLIPTRPLAERIVDEEEELAERAINDAKKLIRKRTKAVDWIRMSGAGRARSEPKAKDIIVQVLTEKRGSRTFVRCHRPAILLLRAEEPKATRFMLEADPGERTVSWTKVLKVLSSAGFFHLAPNRSRLLTSEQLEIFESLFADAG